MVGCGLGELSQPVENAGSRVFQAGCLASAGSVSRCAPHKVLEGDCHHGKAAGSTSYQLARTGL